MRSPNILQKGAFFGVLAACLMLVLTAMAISAVDQHPQPRMPRVHHYQTAESPAALAPERGR